MKRLGCTRNLIASDATFNVLLVTTLVFLVLFRRLREEPKIVDSEMEIISFRWLMGLFAGMMGAAYVMARLVTAFVEAMGLNNRSFEEDAMLFGFLTLAYFLVNLFGFWGILWLLVSPPSVFLGFTTWKAFQD
ncbi:unnamed protein product [Arabidopsis lyrata]|uniref:Predicted protein n=1 Tax=Arabidopsis lyrata subsp. lyrata TaxID=81972 RepID=D7LMU2_ARALL|nr:predicted protein [Arabidopsis lyrata subsp. lyrata]CAH8267588.1 unnamed protein product [Arabidopsis lyrata]